MYSGINPFEGGVFFTPYLKDAGIQCISDEKAKYGELVIIGILAKVYCA